jgi:hypothetical protein
MRDFKPSRRSAGLLRDFLELAASAAAPIAYRGQLSSASRATRRWFHEDAGGKLDPAEQRCYFSLDFAASLANRSARNRS